MDIYTETIASRVDAARRAQGLTIEDLAGSTGIPYTTLYRMLNGTSEFRTSHLFSLARELKADAASWMTDLPQVKA